MSRVCPLLLILSVPRHQDALVPRRRGTRTADERRELRLQLPRNEETQRGENHPAREWRMRITNHSPAIVAVEKPVGTALFG